MSSTAAAVVGLAFLATPAYAESYRLVVIESDSDTSG